MRYFLNSATKKVFHKSVGDATVKPAPVFATDEIQELEVKELPSVAGGPQVKNDPQR